MFPFPIFLAQTPVVTPTPTPVAAPQEIIVPQEVYPLPGQLDRTPVFNSNSPELVLGEGILLSTFPSDNTSYPNAHLNYAFQGRFDIFTHHIAKAINNDLKTLYVGVIAYNPTDKPVTLSYLQGASYLSQPDAPFITLPSVVENDQGSVYAGPGSRIMLDILRGVRQSIFPTTLTILPKSYQMVFNLPIPVKDLTPPLNGRSTYLRMRSDGQLYLASLSHFATLDREGNEHPPTLEQWKNTLKTTDLVTPRDKVPTPPDTKGPLIYGRVAGVSIGSQWQANIYNDPNTYRLIIPQSGKSISYGISTLIGGTYGTNQIQTAPLAVRYPDTAYSAHGNYGVEYDLTFPLYNPTNETKTVTLTLETPLKQNQLTGGLRFLNPPSNSIFFRGTVQVSYKDDQGKMQFHAYHLVQRRGEQGQPLVTLTLSPQDKRLVTVNLLYPPDATPPQVITLKTLE